jgi:ABC-2 type transport system permease protein
MFAHIFKYSLKMHLRQRAELFWTLIYPLVLAVFFGMAFSNLSGADKFTSFPIGVVNNAEYKSQTYFISALKSVSDGASEAKDKLFDVTLMTKEQAEKSLNDNEIKGYILFENGTHVAVKSSGLDQTILKDFMDSYLAQSSAVKTIVSQNPAAGSSLKFGDAASFVKQASNSRAGGDSTVIMYYGLISMAVMFGGFWGRREVVDIQADMSPQGARINMVPVHKLKAFVFSISTSLLIQIGSLLFLIAFMGLVLGVDFGKQLGGVILTCIVSGIMGVTFGAFLAAVIRGSENIRNAVMIGASLLCSVIAGMVSPSLKYIVTQAVPILQYINPANLVSDALYALYYYGLGTRFTLNIVLMLAFSAAFSVSVYLVMRRQKYASL